MANEQISMPSGMGGLTRYFDDFKSKIEIKPSYVIIFVGLLIIFELILRFIK